jgi:hypothetical protein
MPRHIATDLRGEECGEQFNYRRTDDHPTYSPKENDEDFHADSGCPTIYVH